MTTESVEIIVSAQDSASAVLAKTAANVAKVDKEVQATSRSVKEAGGAVGKLANMFGGGWLVNAANQTKDMAEAAKGLSGAWKGLQTGSVALQAGVVALAGVVAFKLGEAISNTILQTGHWKRVLAEAKEEMIRLNQAQSELLRTKASDTQKDISGTSDPVEREKKRADAILAINMNLSQKEQEMAAQRKAKEANENSWMPVWQSVIDEQKVALDAMQQEHQKMMADRTALERDGTDAIESDRQKKAEKTQSAFRKAIDEKVALEKKAAAEAIKADEEKLKMQMKNTEALADAGAKVLERKAKSAMDSLTEAQGMQVDASATPGLQGNQSRFLSRSTGAADYARQSAESAKKSAAIQEASKGVLENMAGNLTKLADVLGVTQIVEFN